jgi:DNA-binding transcriptional ArsR family regulator
VSKIDLLLHPVRMRIVLALAGRQRTPAQIAAAIADVPQTTLYRHLKELLEGGIVTITAERPVRGTVEKVYTLIEGAGRLSREDVASIGGEEHLRYFMVFLSSLLGDFARYLQTDPDPPMVLDQVMYSKVPIYLNDAEREQAAAQLRADITPFMQQAEGRKRYLLATIVIPEQEQDDS